MSSYGVHTVVRNITTDSVEDRTVGEKKSEMLQARKRVRAREGFIAMVVDMESSANTARRVHGATTGHYMSSVSSPSLLGNTHVPCDGEPSRPRPRWNGAVMEWVALTGVVFALRLILSNDILSLQTLSSWTAKGLCHGGVFQGLTCLGQMPQF